MAVASEASRSTLSAFAIRYPPASMFDKLTERLQGVMESLRGRGRLTDENIHDTLRQVRMALLEADVALPVVKTFIDGDPRQGRRAGDRQEPDAGPDAGPHHP